MVLGFISAFSAMGILAVVWSSCIVASRCDDEYELEQMFVVTEKTDYNLETSSPKETKKISEQSYTECD